MKVLLFSITLVLLLSMASSVNLVVDSVASPKPSPSPHEKTRSKKGDGDGVECKNSDSEAEECLVKATVAAHTDYIYTQDLNQSP